MSVTDVQFDKEQAFLLYCTFCGDVERTAHALGLRPVDVLRAADELNWNEQIGPILALKKSARPGDIERAINRALNFVQAHRLRMFIERVINKLQAMSPEEMEDYLFTEHNAKDGAAHNKLTTRALADLASAVEKCHSMTYLALSDTAKDRSGRDESGGGESGGEMHAQIAKAMAAVKKDASPRAILLDAQVEKAEEARLEAQVKVDPYNRE